MKVEISPWSHVETSIPVVPSSHHVDNVVVGFIEHTKSSLSYYHSSRSRKRRKLSSLPHSKRSSHNHYYYESSSSSALLRLEDRIPVLTVSTPHQIRVMVEEEKEDHIISAVAAISEDQPPPPPLPNRPIVLQESAIWQFHSRYAARGTTTTPIIMMMMIPPIYDTQHHCLYAVQCHNTKIVGHFRSLDDDDTTNPTREPADCEVTLPNAATVQSLSILHLPTTTTRVMAAFGKQKAARSKSGSSILFGTDSNSKLFIVVTTPPPLVAASSSSTTTTTNMKSSNSSSGSSSNSRPAQTGQLMIQYLETPDVTTTGTPASTTTTTTTIHNPTRRDDPHHGITTSTTTCEIRPQPQQHAGTIAVVVEVVDPPVGHRSTTTGITTTGTWSRSKKRRANATAAAETEEPQNRSDMDGPSGCIVCFHQVFYTSTSVQLVRQHVRFIAPTESVLSNSQHEMMHCSLYSDQQHTNTVTPIKLNNPYPIEHLQVLGTTSPFGATTENHNNHTTTIVLSYRSTTRRDSLDTLGEMNGLLSSKQHQHQFPRAVTVTTATTHTDCFYTTISTSSRRVTTSSLVSFPFVLPYQDDEILHTCLVGPSMIGVLTQRYKQIYLYDLHRGGLMHIAQPFPISTTNGDDPIACISLLADVHRSKIAVAYTSPGNPEKLSIAYASVNSNNNRSSNYSKGPISLADGLVAASSTIPKGAQAHNRMSKTRTLFPEVDKLSDQYQNEMIIPQQNAIHKAVQMLHELYEKICSGAAESTEPSFIVKEFDNAMQSVSVDGDHSQQLLKGNAFSKNGKVVPANGMKGGNLPNTLPLKHLKKNGGKIVNGLHKKKDLLSPTAGKDQCSNGSENHRQLDRMNGSLQARTNRAKYILSDMPQLLIDTATRTMIAILNTTIPDAAKAHSIRNNARILLRRLIRTGKVSARLQLNSIPTVNSENVSGSSSFLQLLKSLELSPAEHDIGEVWSSYTPFDLICDMFENCADISERQMVVALRYTLFVAPPLDIASYFVRSKNLSGVDSLRKLGSSLLLNAKQDKKGSAHMLSEHKMVVAGTAFTIYRTTKFSIGFNVALLRSAVETEFDMPKFKVLLRLVMEMLSNPDKFHQTVTLNTTSMKNLLQLIVTLFDCLPTFKANIMDVETVSQMERLLAMLGASSSRILSVQKLLQESMESIARNAELSTSPQFETNQPVNDTLDRPKLKPTPTSALPPYQIERLLF